MIPPSASTAIVVISPNASMAAVVVVPLAASMAVMEAAVVVTILANSTTDGAASPVAVSGMGTAPP